MCAIRGWRERLEGEKRDRAEGTHGCRENRQDGIRTGHEVHAKALEDVPVIGLDAAHKEQQDEREARKEPRGAHRRADASLGEIPKSGTSGRASFPYCSV